MNRLEEAEQLHERAGNFVRFQKFSEAEPILRKACILAIAETRRLGEMPSESTLEMVEHYERLLATIGLDRNQRREKFKQLMGEVDFFSRL